MSLATNFLRLKSIQYLTTACATPSDLEEDVLPGRNTSAINSLIPTHPVFPTGPKEPRCVGPHVSNENLVKKSHSSDDKYIPMDSIAARNSIASNLPPLAPPEESKRRKHSRKRWYCTFKERNSRLEPNKSSVLCANALPFLASSTAVSISLDSFPCLVSLVSEPSTFSLDLFLLFLRPV